MVENEIQYIPWKQFQQMVPSILGLEVASLSRHLAGVHLSISDHNIVVKARYDVTQFIDCVAGTVCDDVQQCAEHLSSALLNAMMLPDHPDFAYVIDRLQYVRDRMPYIY